MKCKKSLMGLAALLIVIFHFYIPVLGGTFFEGAEMTLYRACYIGVDIFFFVSACSLGSRGKIKYWQFIKNRLLSLYLPFAIMALIFMFFNTWSRILKLDTMAAADVLKFWQTFGLKYLRILVGIEFFQKGGGSFLWFAIAIMLVYLIAPFLVSLKQRFGWKAFAGFMLFWLALALILQYGFHYTTIFILINRLPIFFLGMYYNEIRKLGSKKYVLPILIAGLIGGGFLIAKFGGTVRLEKPIKEIYYIIAIPFTLSLIGLWDYVATHAKFRNLPLQWIGGFTLELYGLQMIFGFSWESQILKLTGTKKLLTFLLTTAALIAAAFLFSFIRGMITKLIRHIKEKNKK